MILYRYSFSFIISELFTFRMSFMFRKGSFTKEEEKRKKEVSLDETKLGEFNGFRS